MRIKLNITRDLAIFPDKLTIIPMTDSALTIEEDGLYVESIRGKDGIGGTGYDDYYDEEGLRLGYDTPIPNQTPVKAPRVVCGSTYLHRMFDAADSDGKVLLNFRPSVDYVLCGDLYRYAVSESKYKYYLVTEVENVENGTTQIKSSVELGEW